MPTLAFHSNYWVSSAPGTPAGGVSSVGGHQVWMTQFGFLLTFLLLQRF
jgi:hypothetical protein